MGMYSCSEALCPLLIPATPVRSDFRQRQELRIPQERGGGGADRKTKRNIQRQSDRARQGRYKVILRGRRRDGESGEEGRQGKRQRDKGRQTEKERAGRH